MRFLFVKTQQCWPRASGHDVHAYHMMRALIENGHEVALTTSVTPTPEAIDGLDLIDLSVLPNRVRSDDNASAQLTWRQERFRSYWGIEQANIEFVRDKAKELKTDAVVVVGMEVLPYLSAVEDSQRLWYAADEWVWHHLSLVKLTQMQTWQHLRQAALMGIYENSFASVVDRAWVVSAADQRALKLVTGIPIVDVIPNGVDADFFSPAGEVEKGNSCTFWGCLDFLPNIQALRWFCKKVWPLVLARVPTATFHIYGFRPGPEVMQLTSIPGISVSADVPNIRESVGNHQVVVLPFQSGGGVKNKLLEAASMAKPILCSRRACNGLNLSGEMPLRVASNNPQHWLRELLALWADQHTRLSIGNAARDWVVAHHSWNAAAEKAVAL